MDKKLYLEQIDQVNREGKYHPDWESLSAHPVPDWYKEKRLGIFLHWGPFSVPAYHDWYARNMYIEGSDEYKYHLEHFGPHKQFGYKNFIPMLKMEHFDPREWIALFRGMKADYIVPVAEHHDGFQMYESELSKWNAAQMGPKRDVLSDLLLEAGRAGMTIGTSSHRVEHWFFMDKGREWDSGLNENVGRDDLYWPARPEADHVDIHSEPAPDDEFLTDWLLRCCEIVDRLHPRIFYFDWWIHHAAVRPYLKRFAAYYYNRAEEWGGCVINYKYNAFPWGCAVADVERGQFAEAKPFLWQSDTSVMRNSWCYSLHGDYKTTENIIWDLVDVISKNGRMLLNFGPKPDGTFTENDLKIMKELSAWMEVNDAFVHGTGLWVHAQEGPTRIKEGQFTDGNQLEYTSEDFRFTARANKIYACCMRCPADGIIRIKALRDKKTGDEEIYRATIEDVRILGLDKPVCWQRKDDFLEINLGDYTSALPIVAQITIE